MSIPPVPVMTEFDEAWVDWASKTYTVPPETARGMLAGFYTMRARAFPQAIESILLEVATGEASLRALPEWEKTHPKEAAADKAMWERLLPQLREMAR